MGPSHEAVTSLSRLSRDRGTGLTPAVVPTGFDAPVAETLPGVVERMIAAARPRLVILFGSYARGNMTDASDVDLLVVIDDPLPFAERYRLVGGAAVPRPFPLDLIVLSQGEYDEQLATGSHFFRDILAHGKVLHERPA